MNRPDHGPFNQKPNDHINSGRVCPECVERKRLTTETFIERAKAVHGERYDYSLVEFVNSSTKVTIICPDHGPFEQNPLAHTFAKNGCAECSGNKQLTTETFIERAIAIHGDRYDYSEVDYVKNKTAVTIICPDHGPFSQIANSHIDSAAGCPECSGHKRITTETFIERAKAVHGERYDYSLVEFGNKKTKVTIICPDHGPFQQVPEIHYSQKSGCPGCGVIQRADSNRWSTEEFIDRAKAVHGDRYDYSEVDYVNSQANVMIICPDHGPFSQIANSHVNGQGCSDCAITGFNPNEPGLLYYILVTTDDGDTRYKIGITNKTVEDRFRATDLARIRTVKTWRYAIGRAAAERESEILSQYEGDKYYGPDILLSGNTELFTHDILGLDRRDKESG